ncbi:MAG: PEP-CTERM sorting domain-containing protein [Gammaproteobacteria bacterium]|nr:PEP-CTERM sorting domain-containing protein [Gammaproteobacteria bacterium]
MKNKTLKLAALLLAIGPMSAQAVPTVYQITFGPTVVTPAGGTGSFAWDSSTQLISDLMWDFGPGMMGSLDDTLFDWTAPIDGGTTAQYLFEILTGEDTHPNVCGACPFSFATDGFPATGGRLAFKSDVFNVRTFEVMLNLEGAAVAGEFSVSRLSDPTMPPDNSEGPPVSSIPEPATLGLLGLGLVGLLLVRRRKRI